MSKKLTEKSTDKLREKPTDKLREKPGGSRESTDFNKCELEQKQKESELARLKNPEQVDHLLRHNLENFAYRYLETSTQQNIKSQFIDGCWRVSSFEGNLLEALKWNNQDLKPKIIDLAKKFPGAKSKEVTIELQLDCRFVDDNEMKVSATILGGVDQDQVVVAVKSKTIRFEDELDLRNNHAKWLEEVCEIF